MSYLKIEHQKLARQRDLIQRNKVYLYERVSAFNRLKGSYGILLCLDIR